MPKITNWFDYIMVALTRNKNKKTILTKTEKLLIPFQIFKIN